jgi:hypothetical protein
MPVNLGVALAETTSDAPPARERSDPGTQIDQPGRCIER